MDETKHSYHRVRLFTFIKKAFTTELLIKHKRLLMATEIKLLRTF
jgi:hypothetical protein